jgi:hypothetical protein
MVAEFTRLCGRNDDGFLDYAAAVEMIHGFSLIHDDLPAMDNDDMRRGKPSNHKAFGEATAILAGDALALDAFGVICESPFCSPHQNEKAVIALSKYSGSAGMCAGQQTDIDGEGGAIFHYDGFTAELTYSKTGQSHIGSEIIGDNGTLIIPSISKQTDMVVKYTDGTEKRLTGDIEKHELMSYEAVNFYNYITNPEKYREDYKRITKLSLDVCNTMFLMRKQANIVFK